MSDLKIKGLKKLNANLNKLRSISPSVCKEELADIALDFAGKSSNAAPIEFGDLRGDLATPKKINDFSWKVGSSLPYTARQHEHLEYNHPRGGGAKFLEYPFKENVNMYTKQIRKRLEEELNNVTP